MTATGKPQLKVVPPKPRRKAAPRKSRELGVVDQVRLSCRRGNRLATLIGAGFGGVVPLGIYWLSHHEIDAGRALWSQLITWIVLAGLIYSVSTVYSWSRMAFGNKAKALGFVALLEGMMTFSKTGWLAITALVYLMAINAVGTGVRLALGQQKETER